MVLQINSCSIKMSGHWAIYAGLFDGYPSCSVIVLSCAYRVIPTGMFEQPLYIVQLILHIVVSCMCMILWYEGRIIPTVMKDKIVEHIFENNGPNPYVATSSLIWLHLHDLTRLLRYSSQHLPKGWNGSGGSVSTHPSLQPHVSLSLYLIPSKFILLY